VLFTELAAVTVPPAIPAVELSTTTGQAPTIVARGTVFSGTVGSLATGTPVAGTGTPGTGDAANTTAPTAAGQQVNPLQSADTPRANTVGPDLVSVSFTRGTGTTNPDIAVFTFDQPVSATTGAGTLFRVYTNTGQELLGGTGTGVLTAPQVGPGATNNQVAVTFANGTLANAVGGNVLDAAVVGTATGAPNNQQDEVAAAAVQQPTQTTQPAGRTTGPDLTVGHAGHDWHVQPVRGHVHVRRAGVDDAGRGGRARGRPSTCTWLTAPAWPARQAPRRSARPPRPTTRSPARRSPSASTRAQLRRRTRRSVQRRPGPWSARRSWT
jgi:hypothetical protein